MFLFVLFSVSVATGARMNRSAVHEVHWSTLGQPGDSLAVSCDAEGPSVGPIKLLKRSEHGLEPRSTEELDFVLSHALDYRTNMSEKSTGLKAVAAALEKGDLARAMMITQFMWLPNLADQRAYDKAIKAELLVKAGFNPNEPRDSRGRWTTNSSSDGIFPSGLFSPADPNLIPVQDVVIPWLEQILPVDPPAPTLPFPGEIMPPPAVVVPDGAIPQALPRTLDNPYPKDPECEKEWQNAKDYCQRLAEQGWLGGDPYREHGKYYEQCVRGQVSERCGGNPVDRQPSKPRRRRWTWSDDGTI